MSGGWQDSTRKDRLPRNWDAIRRRILERDGGQCTATMSGGRRCWDQATDVHHVGDDEDHSDANLASLCGWHHRKITSAQGNAGRTRPTMRRPEDPHPGLRPPPAA